MLDSIEQRELHLNTQEQQEIAGTAAHEAAHAFVSHLLKIPLKRAELKWKNKRGSGAVVWQDLSNATERQLGIATAAGFAGELLLMGPDYMKSNNFRGFRQDSKMLTCYGFSTQDQKTQLVKEALNLLEENADVFQAFAAQFEERFKQSIKLGKETLHFSSSTLEGMLSKQLEEKDKTAQHLVWHQHHHPNLSGALI